MSDLAIPVILPHAEADDAHRALADDAAKALELRGCDTSVAHEAPAAGTTDGFLLLVTAELDPEKLAGNEDYTQRAVALATIGEKTPETQARMQRTRRILRSQGAFVLHRQLTMNPDAFGVYGLQDEGEQERLEALVELLRHEAERLQLDREGWEPAEN